MNSSSPVRYSLWLLLGALLLFSAFTFAEIRNKAPWSDDAWQSDPVHTFHERGYLGTLQLKRPGGFLKDIDRYFYWQMPTFPLNQVAWTSFVGFGLYRMRVLSLLWGAVAIVAWWQVGRKLFGSAPGAVLIAALVGLDSATVARAADIRPDMMAAALAYSGFALYLTWREQNLSRALLVGNACLAVALFTHPITLIHVAGCAVLVLLLDRTRLRWSNVLPAAIPYFVCAGLWGLYLLQDWPAFLQQFGGNAAGRGSISILQSLAAELRERYLFYFGLTGGAGAARKLRFLILVSYLGAFAYVWLRPALRSQRNYRALAWLALFYCLVMAVYDGQKNTLYMVHLLPIYNALLGAVLWAIWKQGRTWPPFVAGLTAVVVVLQLGAVAQRIGQDRYHRAYLPATRFLQEHADRCRFTMGPAALAFEIGFDPAKLIDNTNLGLDTNERPDCIAIDPQYGGWNDAIAERNPILYKRMEHRLTREYEKIYDAEGYQIYARR